MKGVLFTELIEMMEGLVGLENTNRIIENAKMENKEGAFTSIGIYNHNDLLKLLESLGNYVKNPKEIVLKSYGEYFFYRAIQLNQDKVQMYKDTFSLLMRLQYHLEMEIRKLYPAAIVPFLVSKLSSPNCLEIRYESKQNTSYLLEGVVIGCINYFQESIVLERENLEPDGSKVRFILKKT